MKKAILFATLLLSSVVAMAQAPQQVVRCKAKPEEYANNKMDYVTLADLPIQVIMVTATDLMGKFESPTITIYKNYQVHISGYLNKPGNAWLADGTLMTATIDLYKLDDSGKSQLLYTNNEESNTVYLPKQLDDVKAGKTAIVSTIYNPEYFAAKNLSTPMPKDMVTNLTVICEVAH